MGIEWFRDLVIVIFGLVAIIILIFSAVLAFLAYRQLRVSMTKMNATLDSVKNITSTVENIFCRAQESAGPIANIINMIKTVTQITSMFKKREG